MAKEVMKKSEQTVPAHLKGVMNENWGSENVRKDDLLIPRLVVLQALSPEIKKKDPAYIDGAEQGMIINSVTRELFDGPVRIIPVMFEVFWLLWKDQDLGGGFGGSFDSMTDARNALSEMQEGGWEVVETPTHLCLMDCGGKLTEVAIPMPVSKMKVSRQWNSLVRMLGGPRFSRSYQISGVEDENQKGQQYWNFRVDPLGFVSEKEFTFAKEVYDVLASGDYSVEEESNESF